MTGVHTVTFDYTGYGSYDALLVLALVTLLALAVAPLVWRRARRSAVAPEPNLGDNGDHDDPPHS